MLKKYLGILLFSAAVIFTGCNNLMDAFGMGDDDEGPYDWNGAVRSVILYNTEGSRTCATNLEGDNKLTTLNVNKDESVFLQVRISDKQSARYTDSWEGQGKVNVTWEYDTEYISCEKDNYGLVVTGIKGGGTWIKCSCNGIIATVLISVIPPGDTLENPYIFSNTSVIQVLAGSTATVQASLYGGSVAEMEHFTWSIKDSTIASISAARGNCVVTANRPGTTQITCSHPNAKYSYSFVLFVYTESMEVPYLTTSTNVLTIDRNTNPTANVTVKLNNAYSHGGNNFHWGFDDDDSESGEIVSVTGNGTNATITGIKSGLAKIKVTNDQCEYPLYIYVRVISIVQNVYIKLSNSTVVMEGSEKPVTLYAELMNLPEGTAVNPDDFVWTVESADSNNNPSDCMAWYPNGNALRIEGKKNGKFKVTCKHELSSLSKNCFFILTKQDGSKVDSSMYISTTDNYVQTKEDAEAFDITFRLAGGDSSDVSAFCFYIKGSNGRNGPQNGIAEVQDSYGNVFDMTNFQSKSSASRAVATVSGSATVTVKIIPQSPGEITIIAQHPRCLYECESKIKVYSKYALLEEPVKFTYSGSEKVLYLANSGDDSKKTVKAGLLNAKDGDVNAIKWVSEDESKVKVSPDTGESTVVQACYSGAAQSYITASHEKAESPLRILVVQASTLEDAKKAVFIYAPTSYYRVETGKEIEIEVTGVNVTNTSEKNYQVIWTTENYSIASVSAAAGNSGLKATLRGGVSYGNTTITATLNENNKPVGESVTINVTCVPAGEGAVIEDPVFLTTARNALVFTTPGDSDNISITCNNMKADQVINTTWSCNDLTEPEDKNKPVFEVTGSGENATVQAIQKGKSEIIVRNDAAQNFLSIAAKCGEVYEWTEESYTYIVCAEGEDVINIKNGDETTFAVALAGNSDTHGGDYNWTVTSGKENIEFAGFGDGKCHVKGINPGQSVLTVTNSLADFPKEILVNVANSDEELNGFTYLTTEENVISLSLGNSKTATVKLENSKSDVLTGYTWEADSPSIVRCDSTGTACVLTGLKVGTTRVTVRNAATQIPLEIIVMVVDPVMAADDPYIQCQNIVSCTVGEDAKTITAELIGGSDADKTGFTWSVDDPSILSLYGVNDSAVIKPLKAGMTSIIVHHQKSMIDRRILVICDTAKAAKYYITTDQTVLKMSPSDSETTVTATLVNGDDGDSYNFKWWADNYEFVSINATGGTCVIKPVANGSVNLHVSHPKCADEKVVQLYISQYEVFAFEQTSLKIVGSTPQMVAMEVPTNYSNCYISYDTSPKDTVCTVWGNNSVCTIEPRKAGDCQIIATCKDKGGNIKATARMSVIVEEDVGDVKYLSFEGSTIINLEKGQKTKLSVNLIGNNVKDTTGNGIKWTIKNSNIVNFTTSKNWGTYTDIQAGKPGRTTITISHDETPPLTIYVVVPGEDDAQVLLTPTEKMLYMGGGSESITARVLNDTGEALVWSVIPADQDIIEMKAKLKGCSISPKKVGAVTIVATLPSQPEAPAKCRVEVKETEKLTFFVLDQQGNEAEINNLNVYPSEEMLVYYRTIPAKDTIQSPGTFETNGVFYVTDLGYPDKLGSLSSDKSALAKRVGFTAASCPKDAGAIVVTGGSTVLSRSYSWSTQTAHYADQTLNVMNSYNYYFALEKNAVTESPDDAYGKTFEVTYHVRPATAYVCFDVSKDGAGSDKRYMGKMSRIQFQNSRGTLKTDTNGTVCNQGTNISYYDSGNVTVDQVTKIATGKIRFKVDGECSEDILVTAKNKPLIATSGNVNKTPELVGQQNLNVDVTYGYRNFKVVVSENSSNKTSILLPDGLNYVRPRYDEATGAIFIPMTVKSGDDPLNGSTKAPVTVTLTVNTSVTKHPHIFGADVVDGKISDQMNQVSCSKGRTKNTFTVTIKNDGMSVKNMAPVNSSGLTRVRSHSYVGNLKLTYWLYDAGASDNKGKLKGPEYHEISIPVYAEKLE